MGHPQTEETKRKISIANTGRKRTKAAKKKHSETRKKMFKEGKLKIPWVGTKGVMTWNKKGKESSSWKGGRHVDKNGYVWLRLNHPNSNSSGEIAEHRLIMSNHLKRPLNMWEFVHHKNGIKDDNRIENLQIVSRGVHLGKVSCPYCKKEFAIR